MNNKKSNFLSLKLILNLIFFTNNHIKKKKGINIPICFNKNIIQERIISICDYLKLEKNFESFLNWILDLRKELNIPHKLSEVVEEDKINLHQLSKMALEDPSTATNPKKMTVDDMKILYEHSISGKLF